MISIFGPPDIGKLDKSRDFKGLRKALHYAKDVSVRQAAALALLRSGHHEDLMEELKNIGDDRAVELLLIVLQKSVLFEFVRQAADRLERLGWTPQNDEAGAYYFIAKKNWDRCADVGEPAIWPLTLWSQAKDDELRLGAVQALGRIDSPRTIHPLIEALNSRYPPEVIKTASAALARIGKTGVELLLTDPRYQHMKKEHIAYVLGQIAHPACVEPLLGLLKAGSKEVRKAAAEGLLALYKSGHLTDENKKDILAVRDVMTSKHVDETPNVHSDYGKVHFDKTGCGDKNLAHNDRIEKEPFHGDQMRPGTHEDQGIGIDVPF